MVPYRPVISSDALIAARAVQDRQSTRLHTPRTDVRYGSGHLQAPEGSILDPKAINVLEFFSRSLRTVTFNKPSLPSSFIRLTDEAGDVLLTF
jgi:hypothetical protein